jgi:hypothetical protein
MQNEDTQIKYIKIGSNHKAIKDLQVKREEAQEAYDLAIEDTKCHCFWACNMGFRYK